MCACLFYDRWPCQCRIRWRWRREKVEVDDSRRLIEMKGTKAVLVDPLLLIIAEDDFWERLELFVSRTWLLTSIRIYIGWSENVLHMCWNGFKFPGLATLIAFIAICDIAKRDDFRLVLRSRKFVEQRSSTLRDPISPRGVCATHRILNFSVWEGEGLMALGCHMSGHFYLPGQGPKSFRVVCDVQAYSYQARQTA